MSRRITKKTVGLGDLRGAYARAREPLEVDAFEYLQVDLELWHEGREWLFAHIAREDMLSPLAYHCYLEEDELLHGNIQLGQITVLYFRGHPADECGVLALAWMKWWIERKNSDMRTVFDGFFLEAFEEYEQADSKSRSSQEKKLHRAWRRIFRMDVGWLVHPEDFGAWLVLRAHARREQAKNTEFFGVDSLLSQVV